MWDLEKTAETYPADNAYAPVGLAVASFWVSALVLGLLAFGLSVLTAKGYGSLHDGQRVFISNDVHGLFDGIGLTVILLALSIAVGLLGRAAVRGKKSLSGLWKLSFIGIPLVMAVLFVVAIKTYN